MLAEPDTCAPNHVEEAPADLAMALIQARRTVLPKRLVTPGPDTHQVAQIFTAAAAAPDHGQLLPWRFVIVPAHARKALADVFEGALVERDAAAASAQRQQARDKAFRAPLLLLAIARLDEENGLAPASERLVSAGCAIQNMLLMATALGFGSALTSGKALQSQLLRRLFNLEVHELPLCFMSVGTVSASKPPQARPEAERFVSTLVLPLRAPGNPVKGAAHGALEMAQASFG